jgi:APA family basic amino acid/polyamine antiporter
MRHYPPKVALAIVIANMIGTGVFTSLGFQLLAISSTTTILFLWFLGGICALCGALCYAELGSRHPASGGEYHFLTELIHPYAGFVSGVVSATVGFAAPIALAALTFGSYLEAAGAPVDAQWLATVLIVVLVAIHTRTHAESSAGQYYFTALKIVLIGFFILLALYQKPSYLDQIELSGAFFGELFSGEVAIALIYVTYAFSGWNAATYILGEMENPKRDLPRVLLLGCTIVALLYLALNAVFLMSAPISALRGEVEIGYVVARYLMGEQGALIVSIVLAGILISTVSAMVLAGPRALQRLGGDYRQFGFLGKLNAAGIPKNAIVILSGIALVFLWTSTFEQILIAAGLLMALNTFVTVLAVFISRRRVESAALGSSFAMPLYPLPALIFLLITGWTVIYTAVQFPVQVVAVVSLLVLGYPLFSRLSRS